MVPRQTFSFTSSPGSKEKAKQDPSKEKTQMSSTLLLVAGALMRVGFLLFGQYQDANMEVKYTDIDYLVFSDAAGYVWNGGSPYVRETYRYTPLLSWLLLPNNIFEDFGKWLFITCDLITGLIILQLLEMAMVKGWKKTVLGSIWILNPMVATISTRGSSESVLTVFVMLFVYNLLKRNVMTCAVFAGIAVHFKIYPVIYIPTAIIFLLPVHSIKQVWRSPGVVFEDSVITFVFCTIVTFVTLGSIMYIINGYEFLEHSYLYHFIRSDHRHNFSIYNVSLYFTSALSQIPSADFTRLAFIPQLLLSAVIVPLALTKKSLCDTFLIQTLTFVTFNKVVTSQYFIWFLIFLPLYLRNSSLLSLNKSKGIVALLLWISSQATWLFFAYKLEFLGESTFFPQLLLSSVGFFFVNIYILGLFIDDTTSKHNSSGI